MERLKKLSTGIGYVGSIALFSMMLLTTADVVGRYLFNKPLVGAYEITEFLVLIVIFSFISNAQAHKNHVSVDLLFTKFPKKIRFISNLLNHIACLALMGLISWMSFLKAMELKEVGEASPNLVIPDYPFVIYLVIGCLVLCIEYLIDIIQIASGKREE